MHFYVVFLNQLKIAILKIQLFFIRTEQLVLIHLFKFHLTRDFATYSL